MITVLHGRKRYVVKLETTSMQLMREIEKVTSLKPEHQILLIKGQKVTSENDIDLASQGLKGGKKVMLLVRREGHSANTPYSSNSSCSAGEEMCQRVRAAISRLDSVEAELQDLKKTAQPPGDHENMATGNLGSLKQRLRVISETCMEMLLALDSVQDEKAVATSTPPAWKLERKSAVDRLHQTLDVVDNLSQGLNHLQQSPSQ